MSKLRIVIAQLNLSVGNIQANLDKLIGAAKTARDELQADVIVFPELCITGYPAEDLLLRKSFLDAAMEALYEFKQQVQDIYCVVGHPYSTEQGLLNACSLIYNGDILGRYAKQYLPNYGVFDEERYFTKGSSACVVPIKGISVGMVICEDLWNEDPIKQAVREGAQLILSPNASPYEIKKHEYRQLMLKNRSSSSNVPIVYTNCVGGQDEIVFDGGSMVVDAAGKICQHAGFFNETLLPVDLEVKENLIHIPAQSIQLPRKEEQIYQALVTGVRDYVHKNHFKTALIGVSGGIDSALTLAIAVDALGKKNVKAIMMPSRHTSDMSMNDSMQLITALDVAFETISIESTYTAFQNSLQPHLSSDETSLTQQNMQARCRGVILMALSNQTGAIVLSTSNRSEMAVGYSTLYGDMAGGFAVLKDVPKTLVYELCAYRNKINPVIPQSIIDRPPTAELAPDQKDEDSLPPYPLLDKILELYLNEELGADQIIAQGFEKEIVEKVIHLIHKSEYKRQQASLGPRINYKSFGKDRRYPVTCGFND